jgi:hypothetical protein
VLVNENKIKRVGKKSAGIRLKGHFPKKDGAFASLLSKAFAASEC